MDEIEREEVACEACGHLIVEYSFNLNKGLCGVLVKLFEAGEPVEIASLRLSNSQYSNYPKLAYWNLARRVLVDGNHKGGVWEITGDGVEFVTGRRSQPKKVVMKNKLFVRFDGEPVMFSQIVEGYDFRPFYKEQAKAQIYGADGQGKLFE